MALSLSKFNFPRIIAIISIVYIIAFFTLSSGLVNSIIEGSRLPDGIYFVPNRSVQTIYETVSSVFILILGFGGLYMIHYSSNLSSEKKRLGLITAGTVILSISVLLGYHLINSKV